MIRPNTPRFRRAARKPGAHKQLMPMRRENGTFYVGSTVTYFQPKSTRTRWLPIASPSGLPVINEKGEIVKAEFPVPMPWRRVSPRLERPGFVRRRAQI